MRVETVSSFVLHSALNMSFDAIKELALSVFPEKSKKCICSETPVINGWCPSAQ